MALNPRRAYNRFSSAVKARIRQDHQRDHAPLVLPGPTGMPPTSTGSSAATRNLPPKLTNKGNAAPADIAQAPRGDGYGASSNNPTSSERDPTGERPEPTPEETALCGMVDDLFMASWQAMRPSLANWLTCLSFYRGDQWVRYNEGSTTATSLRDPTDKNRVYSQHNHLIPIVKHLHSRAKANQSEAIFRPKTGRDVDMQATAQMRSIWEHVKIVNAWERLLDRVRRTSIIFAPSYFYVTYNTTRVVDVPVWEGGIPKESKDPLSTDYEIEEQSLGEIEIAMLSGQEVFWDTTARSYDEALWCMIAQRKSLGWVRSTWSDRGRWVQAEDSGTPGETVALQVDSVTDNMNARQYETGRYAVIVKTYWEKPSLDYPNGRYIVTAGDQVLEEREWLYPRMKGFPIVPLCYVDGVETIWGDNALTHLIEPMRDRNRALSAIAERTRPGGAKLLVARGSNIDSTAFKSGAVNEVISYDHKDLRGGDDIDIPPPIPWSPAPLDPAIEAFLQVSLDDLKAISSVNDPTLGLTKGDLSGVSVNALQDADQSEGTIQRDNEKWAVEQVAERVGCLVQQFYLDNEPRLIFVQDSAPTRKPILPVKGGGGDGGPMNAQAGGSVGVGAGPQAGLSSPQILPAGSQPGASAPPPPSGVASGVPPFPPGIPGAGDIAKTLEDTPTTEAMVFRRLAKGRWTVTSTAAASISPSAKRTQIMQMFASGAFSPEQLPVAIVMLRELELFGDSDAMEHDLLTAMEMAVQAQAKIPPPDPAIQAQIEGMVKSAVAAAQADQDIRVNQAKIAAQALADAQKIEAQTQSGVALQQAKSQFPTTTIAGKFTPAAELAEEEKLGLDVHSAATHLHDVSSIGATAPVPGGVPYGIAPPPPTPGFGPDGQPLPDPNAAPGGTGGPPSAPTTPGGTTQ